MKEAYQLDPFLFMPEKLLKERSVEVSAINDSTCKELMKSFIDSNENLWNEDIGV